MRNKVVLNGIEYRPVSKAKKQQIKAEAKEQLKQFMAKKGYKPVSEKPATYVRNDGRQVNATELKYSNGKTYMATAFRFWKVK